MTSARKPTPSSAAFSGSASSTWNPLASPVVWGTAACTVFYLALPQVPWQRELLQRYFAGHWIEYATMWLFCIGMSILARKWVALSNEREVFRHDLLAVPEGQAELEVPVDLAKRLATHPTCPERAQQTWLWRRVRGVCDFVTGRKSGIGVEEHLKYLAELSLSELHNSYSLVRTVTWAIPILGFLGTVIGITMAIAYITPEQLETAMGEVTSGLAVAFDTTALSLGLSMVLVFATFATERAEQEVISRVEEFGIDFLAVAFTDAPTPAGPFAEAEIEAAKNLLSRTESIIKWQTDLWQTSLETLRERWVESATQQQVEFTNHLQQGLKQTWEQHDQQLSIGRQEFLTGMRQVQQELTASVDSLKKTMEVQHSEFADDLGAVLEGLKQHLAQIHQQHQAQNEGLLGHLATTVSGWHDDLLLATDAMAAQLKELQKQGDILSLLTENEGEVIRLQQTMQANFQSLRTLESLDETMNSLNAAIHLLTVRARPHAA